MTERLSHHHPNENHRSWDRDKLGHALNAPSASVTHPGFGQGDMYLLTGQATTLEVFPGSGVARIRAGAAEITLYHQEPPKLKAAGVLFSQESDGITTRVLVAQNGEVLLGISPGGSDEPLERPRAAFLTPADRERPPAPERVVSDDSTAPEGPINPPPPPGHTQQAKQETAAEIVALVGRVGRAPHVYRKNRQGREVLIATFQLNSNYAADTAVWNHVYAYDKAARFVRAKVHQGQLVGVRGSVYDKRRKVVDGEEHTSYRLSLHWLDPAPDLP